MKPRRVPCYPTKTRRRFWRGYPERLRGESRERDITDIRTR